MQGSSQASLLDCQSAQGFPGYLMSLQGSAAVSCAPNTLSFVCNPSCPSTKPLRCRQGVPSRMHLSSSEQTLSFAASSSAAERRSREGLQALDMMLRLLIGGKKSTLATSAWLTCMQHACRFQRCRTQGPGFCPFFNPPQHDYTAAVCSVKHALGNHCISRLEHLVMISNGKHCQSRIARVETNQRNDEKPQAPDKYQNSIVFFQHILSFPPPVQTLCSIAKKKHVLAISYPLKIQSFTAASAESRKMPCLLAHAYAKRCISSAQGRSACLHLDTSCRSVTFAVLASASIDAHLQGCCPLCPGCAALLKQTRGSRRPACMLLQLAHFSC